MNNAGFCIQPADCRKCQKVDDRREANREPFGPMHFELSETENCYTVAFFPGDEALSLSRLMTGCGNTSSRN